MTDYQVLKRDGSLEPLDYNKIHKVIFWACEGLDNVSESEIEMTAALQIYDGIETSLIHQVLINSARDLISEENPQYQYAAARLVAFDMRKRVWGGVEAPDLESFIKRLVDLKVYDRRLMDNYSSEEMSELGSYIEHDRDLDLTFAGISQIQDKYVLQDRTTGAYFETPQLIFMMVSMGFFMDDTSPRRLDLVKRFYDHLSEFKINLPTPIIGGLRSTTNQYASCVLVDVDDNMNSIFNSNTAIGLYIGQRAGIGINAGRIRALNSPIRGGSVSHTGLIPFIKMFAAATRSCTQNGIRGGNSTIHFPFWHKDFESLIVLKNNKGEEDTRERRADYSVQLTQLFYDRIKSGQDISLFSPHDVPGLFEAMCISAQAFEELYLQYEADESIPRETLSARTMMTQMILAERLEVGKIYYCHMDYINEHSPFDVPIYMSNLCQETVLPTKPIQSMTDPEGEIATCILGCVNLGKLTNVAEELPEICELLVRGLDNLIDIQEYPVLAAEKFTKERRALLIGWNDVAHHLAKLGIAYSSDDAAREMNRVTELLQYNLLKASVELAKERGKCEKFHETKYSRGLLPLDHYHRGIDEVVGTDLQCDWETLRGEIVKHGLRHSTLTGQPPCESSSVVSNSTNGIEPPRSMLSVKRSRKNQLPILVPDSDKYVYEYAFDRRDNLGQIKLVGAMQKWMDQGISANMYYDPEIYPKGKVPINVLMKDMSASRKYGWKTAYYVVTDDKNRGSDDAELNPDEQKPEKRPMPVEDEDPCASGACAV